MLPDTGPFPSRIAYQEHLEQAAAYEARLEDRCAKGIYPAGRGHEKRSVHRIACERVLAILRQPRPLEERDFDAMHAEMAGIFEQDFCSGSCLDFTILFTDEVMRAASSKARPDLKSVLKAARLKRMKASDVLEVRAAALAAADAKEAASEHGPEDRGQQEVQDREDKT